ncbi:MAG: hypothetical protein Q9172_004348, partial [Xanthocarpia lactea]
EYDKYSLRSYLTDVAGWSEDAINLYDLGNAHVVFENGFIESFKDAFLSSNQGGTASGMQQLQKGMDEVPNAFLKTYPSRDVYESLLNNITFGARVEKISDGDKIGTGQQSVKVYYINPGGQEVVVESDYLILAVPYTAQRAITKDKPFAVKQERAIREVRYVEVTKVLLQYQKRWWKDVFGNNVQGTDGGVVCDLPIRYTMFPKEDKNSQFANGNPRGAVMAAYTFKQDATIIGVLSPERRAQLAARNLDTIFPEAKSLELLEASTSQVFPADELAGGSAFCYFGPAQKEVCLPTMMEPDWARRVFFAGEQAGYTHGWIQGALEAALRCVLQVYDAATTNVTLGARQNSRGSYTVPGLGTRKQAILGAGGNTLDIAIAMLESERISTDYAYGDNKSGDAANFGVFKQNWGMLRQCARRAGFVGQRQDQWNNGARLNSDLYADVASRWDCQGFYGYDRWFAGHRNGATGLNNPYTEDINSESFLF